MKKDFISIEDLSPGEVERIFRLTETLKKHPRTDTTALKGMTLALIFQKPSNRTRVSFEVGIAHLGGHSIYLGPDDIKLGVREATKDVASVLSRYVDGIVARTFLHQDITELAGNATVPVINGLSDLLHPCQGMADIFTVREKLGRLKKVKFAFIGDGNNVLNSLMHGCSQTGVDLRIATPKGYEPAGDIVRAARAAARVSGGSITIGNRPMTAADGADVIYTDVWTSMGQEDEYRQRQKDFRKFQINRALLAAAAKHCLVMHCLPAHRGEEITDDVLDGPHSVVLDQAENRMHVQKAIMVILMGKK